ncbi:hypothetical protein Tco_0420355 [Tanacetum coccineum]
MKVWESGGCIPIREVNWKICAHAEVTLVNETQERHDEDLMFDTGVLDGNEMFVDAITGEKDEHSTKIDDSTAGEAVTTGVKDSTTPTIQVSTADIIDEGVTAAKINELTLAQTLIEIKEAKPKVVIIDCIEIFKIVAAEIIERERLERQKQEEANIALIESWENTQAMDGRLIDYGCVDPNK